MHSIADSRIQALSAEFLAADLLVYSPQHTSPVMYRSVADASGAKLLLDAGEGLATAATLVLGGDILEVGGFNAAGCFCIGVFKELFAPLAVVGGGGGAAKDDIVVGGMTGARAAKKSSSDIMGCDGVDFTDGTLMGGPPSTTLGAGGLGGKADEGDGKLPAADVGAPGLAAAAPPTLDVRDDDAPNMLSAASPSPESKEDLYRQKPHPGCKQAGGGRTLPVTLP